MAKNLFEPNEIKNKGGEFQLKLVHDFSTPVVEEKVEEVPEYSGPTAEDLKREADEGKAGKLKSSRCFQMLRRKPTKS